MEKGGGWRRMEQVVRWRRVEEDERWERIEEDMRWRRIRIGVDERWRRMCGSAGHACVCTRGWAPLGWVSAPGTAAAAAAPSLLIVTMVSDANSLAHALPDAVWGGCVGWTPLTGSRPFSRQAGLRLKSRGSFK